MEDKGTLVTNPPLSHTGLTNPGLHTPGDVELITFTQLADDEPSPNPSKDKNQQIPDRAPSVPAAIGSEVFGLDSSASGHVPMDRAEENEDGLVYEVDSEEGGGKEGHTALEKRLGIEYSVTDVPPVHMCFLFGLQQVLLSISSTISIPLVVSAAICAGELPLVRSEIISTFLFMCGVSTVLQVLVGVRLPIIQGGSGKFIPAVTSLMALDQWKCPSDIDVLVEAYHNGSADNVTEIWQSRLREVQGGIMLASMAQVLIGCTGFLGILLDYVGPITIVPTISLIGLSLVHVALRFCQTHWGISALTIGLVFLFSLYLCNIRVPFPSFTRKNGCRIIRYPIFKLLPVILAVILAWGLCAVLTATDTLEKKGVRTDSKTEVLDMAQWFFFPYPGQWGLPTVSLASFVAMLAATIASIIESVGDYYACARISGVPPPPAHAMNRGIAIEGLGSLISGAVGSGGATTSYSQNVGSIGFTKVASRWAFFTAGLIFLVSGMVGKFGALLTTMPDPVLGGIILVSFGMVTAVGLSSLAFVDLSSGRNLAIIGSSLMIGLMVPDYMKSHPDAIDTGNQEADGVLTILLSTDMFIGGLVAFLLDNTAPGTAEERGIIKWRQLTVTTTDNSTAPDSKGEKEAAEYMTRIYGFPFLSNCLERVRCCRYVPFMPSFALKRVSPFKWLYQKIKKKA